MDSIRLSAVIKARNEERHIAGCLESLRGLASEIIVVNDRSEDATAQIAGSLGARVVDAESQDGMINVLDKIGFEAATGEWILRIDADERMAPTLAQKLREAAESGRWAGVRYARKQIMFGAWVRHGGWFRNDQLRFFRADAWDRQWNWADLHSQVPVKGTILTLPSKEKLATVHLNYDTIQQAFGRVLVDYARTEAIAASRDGRTASLWRLLAKPVRRFLGLYLVRQGFRDGWRGAMLAGMLAAYDFCIEANLWDFARNGRDRLREADSCKQRARP